MYCFEGDLTWHPPLVWSFRRGRRSEQRGDDEAAERQFRAAAERGDAHAAFHVGLVRERRGDDAGAWEWFKRAAGGGDGEAAKRLYELADRDGGREARARWAPGAAEAEKMAAAFDLGYAALRAEPPDLSAAERWYRRALEGGEVHAANNLARVLRRMGRDDEAEPLYRRGVELGDEIAAVNLAALLREHDRQDETVAVLRAAAEAGGYEAAEQLARTLYDADRHDEAERWFRRAAEDDELRPGAMTCVGVLLDARGEDEEAERWLRRGAEAGDPNATAQLGVRARRMVRSGTPSGSCVGRRRPAMSRPCANSASH